jgi:hypothetical protein
MATRVRALPKTVADLMPLFGPDPRQVPLSAPESDEKLLTTSIRGYPASHPDLSVIQWTAHVLASQYGFDRRDAIRSAVYDGVQQLDALTMKPVNDVYEVTFVTADQFGKYRHSFTVDFSVRSYPTPAIIERMQKAVIHG